MSEILEICASLPTQTFKAGEALIVEGSVDNRLFFLVSGSVSILKGTEEVARVSDAGAIFGEMSMLLDIPSSATVLALTDVVVHCAEDGETFLAENPRVPLHMARMLAQRLFNATAYIADIKAQFADRTDHFALMDKILDELMHQQQKERRAGSAAKDDPRL